MRSRFCLVECNLDLHALSEYFARANVYCLNTEFLTSNYFMPH